MQEDILLDIKFTVKRHEDVKHCDITMCCQPADRNTVKTGMY